MVGFFGGEEGGGGGREIQCGCHGPLFTGQILALIFDLLHN